MGEGRQKRGRLSIALCCSVCGARNYKTTKARREGSPALALNKFCRVCNRHTTHIEAR